MSGHQSARLRVLRTLMNARIGGIGRGWLSLGGICRGIQADKRVAIAGVNDALNLGHVEMRTIMGNDHYRITGAGGAYITNLQRSEKP